MHRILPLKTVSQVINHALKAGKKPRVRDKARGPHSRARPRASTDVEMELVIKTISKYTSKQTNK